MKRMQIATLMLALIFAAKNASAYVISRNSSGQALHWSSPASPTFYANYVNSSGLSYSDVFTAFTNAFQRWTNSGSASISFDYWQGSNPSSTPVSWGNDNRNAIFFSSQSTQKMGGSTIGVTYVFSSGGTIVETDIEFNDDAFTFTTTSSDSSAFGSGNTVFLENVATHEFGHAYGLSHSSELQSTMVYLEYRQQAHLSCDDIQGIAANYPLSSFTSGRGTISGSVLTTGSAAIFGAHVEVISKTRGTVIAGVISDSDGSYSIPNLEPGDYYLFVEPFAATAPISSLCGGSASGCYYGTVNSSTACSSGTAPFKRGFIETSTGVPQTFTVTSGGIATAPNYTVSCSAISGSSTSTTTGGAITLISNNSGAAVSAVRDAVMGVSGTNHYWALSNVSGTVSAKVLSYSIYSPFNPTVTITDTSGSAITSATTTSDVFTGNSTYVNYDSTATLSGASGNYLIKVTNAGALSSTAYPAGAVSSEVDSTRYYLLIVTINDSTSLLSLPTNNARCEATDSFSAFPDHGTPPANSSSSSSSSSSSTSSSGGGGGGSSHGCLSVYDVNGRHDHPNGPTASAVFSMWGLALMMALCRIVYRLNPAALARRTNRR